ncbi:hypothetical protein pdam_00009568 [Pocillopora damicornis]|uniref:Uncharacterized protein n=1 Tax=Pocillopora damicornis TaxID=46731 RepID=A0A3M6UQ59_POCDA|nr:hypothetical protein pdam_00009568 [Pocillopora damicornis]
MADVMAVGKVFKTFRGDILHKDCKATATPLNIRTRTGTRFCKMFDELNYRNVPAFYFATPDWNEAFQHTGAACITSRRL